ncbi:murein hydrolase activator EnvC [Hoylesella buccalis]|uniref:Peptidase M23 n=1 Tax=Hoylesella buccalis DNF00853 TaxID=1401074 RepID=A0A096BKS3_9BACT|nr:peptidoglycan DD-metalloendopeptidase family protein [Hoylesella buccalis]KGF33739.1 peptidase M23 [Hoylesella buccalis DNF00853]
MKRYLIILLSLALTVSLPAQKKRTPTKQRARTTKTTTKKKKTTQKKSTKTAGYSNSSIKGLESQRSQIQKKIKQQERALRTNQSDVKKRLQDLLILNTAINDRQKNIDSIEADIHHLNGNIDIIKSQLQTLQTQLAERKQKYIKSMAYMTRSHTIQDKIMFIFSAKNFAQMYRRFQFVRDYATYQRAQGEGLKAKQAQVEEKHVQLQNAKGRKNNLLYQGKKEKQTLEGQQVEQKQMVSNLQKQQKTIQNVIAEQRKKDAALNAEIDKLIAIEVAKAKARAEAEAKRKAAIAEAARKRVAELARKKAEAEAAARENARRIAEAKEREERLKAEARAAAAAAEKAQQEKSAAQAKAAAEAQTAAEQTAREAAERKAASDAVRNKETIARAQKRADESLKMSSVDRMLSGGFEANRGRLPIPITGGYRIVSHFGQYNVEGLKNVTLDNKGVNILGSPGCKARAIYDGEVSAVMTYAGTMVVMVRHGSYISVYCNLGSVNVSKGQKVKTRQVLGGVGRDNILQFQLRNGTAKLNPESWLGR